MKIRLREFIRTVGILLVAIYFSGCEVVFLNPLSTPRDAAPDKRLLGEWVKEDEKNSGVHIRFDQGANMEVNISAHGGDNTEQNPVFTMFTTWVGRAYYMNLNPTDEHRGEGYLIAKYAVSGDELTVWMLDPDKVKAAIAHGRIKGQVARGSGTATVSDSPGQVAALLESPEGDDLFMLFGNFERVKRK